MTADVVIISHGAAEGNLAFMSPVSALSSTLESGICTQVVEHCV